MKIAFGKAVNNLAGSSTKSMIGYPQGACGAAGVAATLMAIRDGVIPPTINAGEPAADCQIDLVRAPRPARLSAALILARGIGGFNTALVVRGRPA